MDHFSVHRNRLNRDRKPPPDAPAGAAADEPPQPGPGTAARPAGEAGEPSPDPPRAPSSRPQTESGSRPSFSSRAASTALANNPPSAHTSSRQDAPTAASVCLHAHECRCAGREPTVPAGPGSRCEIISKRACSNTRDKPRSEETRGSQYARPTAQPVTASTVSRPYKPRRARKQRNSRRDGHPAGNTTPAPASTSPTRPACPARPSQQPPSPSPWVASPRWGDPRGVVMFIFCSSLLEVQQFAPLDVQPFAPLEFRGAISAPLETVGIPPFPRRATFAPLASASLSPAD